MWVNRNKMDINSITFILGSLHGGGVQKATFRLIGEFQKMGKSTTLIIINHDGSLMDQIPSGCKVIDLKVRRARDAYWNLKRSLIEIIKPEIIISAQTHINVLIILVRLLSNISCKLIVVEHITFNKELISKEKFFERMRPWLIKLFYRYADEAVAVSPSSAKSIHEFSKYKKKIRVIQNGLDLEGIKEQAKEFVAHSWINNNKIKLLVSMGRLSHQKNFPLLLKSFSMLSNIKPYRLIILGEGSEKETLKKLAEELNISKYIDFYGFTKNPYPILTAADLFVLSSNWEGFSNVVIESLACGIPIVATNCPGGPADILSNQPFGKIVPMNNPEQMASAIEQLTDLEIDKSSIIEYSENFTIKDTAQQYIDLIANI